MLVVFSLLLCDAFFRAHCYNLDTRWPTVKRGPRDTYFGYSVAGHQSVQKNGKTADSWILVGAPLGQSLRPGTNHSGVLWKCPYTRSYDDCNRISIDGRNVAESEIEQTFSKNVSYLSPPKNDEITYGQWLGGTVRSLGRGKKVLVCAHRHIQKQTVKIKDEITEFYLGQGLCYVLQQNLDLVQMELDPCRGRPTKDAQAQFGYCQAGTSGVILDDDSIVIGSPGSYNWKGNIYMVNISDNYNDRDKVPFKSPVDEIGEFPEKNSYLGMSTTAAKFLGQEQMVYATGAPRANGTGQVVLYTISNSLEHLMNKILVLKGEKFASSFGYELATADLDGDKKPDLIVGAPFYFTEKSGGAVYVYMSDKNHCLDCMPPIKIVGKPESRFGFAITNLGDLNKDGYDDIAVGAPYEGNGVIYIYEGSADGIVILPSQVIKAEDLVIDNLKIRTLGYSLSGNGVDLDQNGYPDLISGAYESDVAILIRSRPIVNISISVGPLENLRNINTTKTGCSSNKTTSVTCFTFETCCALEPVVKEGSSDQSGVKLHYKLEAETFQDGRKFSRVWFGPYHNSKPQTIENNVSVDFKKNKKTCQQHTAYLKANTMDIQSPIALRISYSLVQNNVPVLRPGDPVRSLNAFPVLSQNQSEKTFNATFHKDCGNNDRCESRVRVDAELLLPKIQLLEYEFVGGQHVEILLNTTAHNHGESAYESKMFIVHPPSFNYIGTVKSNDTKQTDCNLFNKTMVVCALGNPFKNTATSNIQLRFDPNNLDDAEEKFEFVLFSNTTSHEIESQVPLVLRVKVVKRAEVSIKGSARPEQVFYGYAKKDSSVKYRDEVGSRVVHIYQVFNSGPWKVSNLEVHVEWPIQVGGHNSSSEYLLYLDENPIVDAFSGGECYMAQGQVNPLGLLVRPGVQESPLDSISTGNATLNYHMASKSTSNIVKNSSSGYFQNRVRRDSNYVVGAEPYVKDNEEHIKTVKLNCLLGSAKCFNFRCRINNLQKNEEATIFIKARLWNTTLLQPFHKVDVIVSRATIVLPSQLSPQKNISDDVFEVETTAKVHIILEQQQSKPNFWWYILAILVGLLLLYLLSYVLWKLGFFKRHRPEHTANVNADELIELNAE